MSDSESQDSDEGIRYKTDSVRNKTKITEFSRRRSRDRHHKDDRSRHRKRYSRSPSPKKYSDKKCKKRRKTRSNSREDGSTSSSYDKSKNKFAKKELKQRDKSVPKRIGLHSQNDMKLSSVADQIKFNQNEIIGPALPPHLQVKINENSSDSRIPSYVEQVNKLPGDSPGYRSHSPVVGPELQPNITIISTKTESYIGPIVPTNIKTSDSMIEQSQHTFKDEDDDPKLPSYIGPQLPPHLLNTDKYSESEQDHNTRSPSSRPEDNADKVIGPSLPPHLRTIAQEVIEPYCLESTLQAEKVFPLLPLSTLAQSQTNDADKVMEPSLPPHLRKIAQEVIEPYGFESKLEGEKESPLLSLSITSQTNDADKVMGPSLPPHLRKIAQEVIEPYGFESKLEGEKEFPLLSLSTTSQTNDADKVIGPSLPPHLRKKIAGESSLQMDMQVEEEEDVYGPLPAGMSEYSLSHKALEERALQLKIDQLAPQGNNEPVRESWMIELPSKAANFGLGPRQFRNRPGPDLSDRSSWTDLPGDKKKKKTGDVPVDVKAEAELRELRKRDEEQEILTKKHKRKEKSLLKMHKEKIEKEKKNEKPNERRPFSRDIDLQANRFDDAQKQAIMKKAQLLDTRFSSGKSKFL